MAGIFLVRFAYVEEGQEASAVLTSVCLFQRAQTEDHDNGELDDGELEEGRYDGEEYGGPHR